MIKYKVTKVLKIKLMNLYSSLSIKRKISLSFSIISLLLLLLLIIISNNLSSNTIVSKTIENTIQNLNLVSEKFDMLKDSTERFSKIALLNKEIG